ncbi:diguanylate cyclase [Bacillaceae bacterium CLA-AA-H227]|uniref:Diguanylate cyclase n=1 Tax=Robertmurraya yapensis (ex Hitch et al 2024) TaxID=3133160 RepID=A0ACC6S662_9BACI
MILNIIEDLIPNLAIFVSTSFLIYFLMRNRIRFKNFNAIKPTAPLPERMIYGVIDGIIGSIILHYGITVDNVLIDLRHFPIMVSALFGGIPSALITGAIIACSRYFLFDDPSFSTMLGVINAFNMSLVCGMISTYLKTRHKWLYMNIYCFSSITVVGVILLEGETSRLVFSFFLVSCISAFCIFYLHDYLSKTLYLLRKTKENDDKFRAITDNISDVVAILDKEGNTTYVSPSIRNYGIEPKKYNADFYENLIHPEDRSRVISLFRSSVEEKKTFRIEIRWRTSNGSWSDVDISGTPIIENNTVTSVVLVCRDITERKKLEQSLLYLSNNDGLTGVANRRYFDERLNIEWDRSIHNHSFLSLILFDIDDFELYNDTYGHQAGDICLKTIASYVKEIVRSPHLIARYGGEEFAAILIGKNNEESYKIAEKIRTVVESLKISNSSSENKVITISLGLATQGNISFRSKEELIEKADLALYEAKKGGRNRVVCYNPKF